MSAGPARRGRSPVDEQTAGGGDVLIDETLYFDMATFARQLA
ncbi:hypothetical protein OG698_48410 (plasmid) [Streptomyces sp. NBC_01003]|nr:hypothetical protein OG698_48410 [Streptomyces sp. NBC_01003]